jgi:serine/threonine-protein kinase
VQETFSRLTSTPVREDLPTWSPDGRFLYYVVVDGENRNVLFRVPADASGSPEAVLTADGALEDIDMSADGRLMVFKVANAERNDDDIWYVDFRADSVPRPFLSTEADEEGVGISPDGRWLAYESDESGRDEVYIRAFPGGGARIPISLDGGTDPIWAHSGTELFFMDRARDMLVAARLEIGASVTVAARDALFPVGGYEWGSGEIQHAIAPDDQSFLFIGDRMLTTDDPGELILVLNFFEELKERAGS